MNVQRIIWIGGALGLITLTILLSSRPIHSVTTTPARAMDYLVDKDVHTVSSNTRGDKKVTDVKDVYAIFDQRPDGSILYGRQNGPELQHSDTTFKTSLWMTYPNGRSVELVKNDVMRAEFFPNGKDILYETDRAELFELNAKGKTILLAEKAETAAISPDGKRVVYMKLNPDWKTGDYSDRALGLTVLDIATGVETRLTNTWEDFDPGWSPDGKTISFGSGRTQLASIWLMDADGKNQRQITNVGQTVYDPDTTMTAPSHRPLWSADAKHLVYEADRKVWSLTLSTDLKKLNDKKILAFGEQPMWLDDQTVGIVAAPSNTTSPKVLKVGLDGNVVQ